MMLNAGETYRICARSTANKAPACTRLLATPGDHQPKLVLNVEQKPKEVLGKGTHRVPSVSGP